MKKIKSIAYDDLVDLISPLVGELVAKGLIVDCTDSDCMAELELQDDLVDLISNHVERHHPQIEFEQPQTPHKQ